MLNDIKLGMAGSEYDLPKNCKLRRGTIEIVREERAASGKLGQDVTATKEKFTLDYQLIDDDDLQLLQHIYNMQSELSLIITVFPAIYPATTTAGPGAEETESYTVIMRPIERDRILAFKGGLWGGVTVELEEV